MRPAPVTTAPDAGQAWGYPRVVAAAAGAFLAGSGIWAMAAPRSFFDAVATFEPYNRHFLLDLGAFQIGLGAVLLLAAARPRIDGLVCALLGVGAGSAAHVLSHAVTTGEGGSPGTDIPTFSIITVLLMTAGMARWRQVAPR